MSIRLIIIILILSSVGTFHLFAYSLFKVKSTKNLYFSLFLLSVLIYILGYAFEISQDSLRGISLSLKLEYLGIPFIAVFWFLFSLKYSGDYKVSKILLVFIFIIPSITVLMLLTNHIHFLHYKTIFIDKTGPFPVVSTIKGPWYIIDYIYKNILIFGGTIVFFRMIFKNSGLRKKQAIIICAGSLIPSLGNLLTLLGWNPLNIDMNPFYLSFTVPVFGYAMFRLNLFNIAPIAYIKIFEKLNDPIMILDNSSNIIDFNISAEKLFPELDESSRGNNIKDIIKGNRSELENIEISDGDSGEIELNRDEKRFFTVNCTKLLSGSGANVGLIIMLHDITEHKKTQMNLYNLATLDELTQLYNRRFFSEIGLKEMNHNRRQGRTASMLLLDIDYFKNVNDTFGHGVGDIVLQSTAMEIKRVLRECDLAGRYGGEEFTVFLPETELDEAMCVAERLRMKIEACEYSFDDFKVSVTVSIGISSTDFSLVDLNIDSKTIFEKLLLHADKALYKAKRNGRNRIEIEPFKN